MSNSVRPHRRQPTRLPCPWDSPGKNTGVGCHFLLQFMKVKSESEVAQSDPQRPHGLQPTRLLCPWDFPGKSTGVGCHCLLRYTLWASPKLDLLSAPDFILFVPMITQGRVNFEDCIIPIGRNTERNWGAVQ